MKRFFKYFTSALFVLTILVPQTIMAQEQAGFISLGNENSITPTQPSTPTIEVKPIISNIKVDQITKKTALISWITDRESDSMVDYGPTPDHDLTVDSDKMTKEHSLFVSELEPGTQYHFQVKSRTKSGEESNSDNLSFNTLGYQAEIKVLSFEENEPLEGLEVIFPGPPPASKITDAKGKVIFNNLPLGNQWITISSKNNDSAGFTIEILDYQEIQKFEVKLKKPTPKTNLIVFMLVSIVLVVGSVFALIKIWSKPSELDYLEKRIA
ncbi:MAG: fibronectin type III domain-containing protein [Candidatus Nealsonbacteria bacterium]